MNFVPVPPLLEWKLQESKNFVTSIFCNGMIFSRRYWIDEWSVHVSIHKAISDLKKDK